MRLKYSDSDNPEDVFYLDVPMTAQEVIFGDWTDFKSVIKQLDLLPKEQTEFETEEQFKNYQELMREKDEKVIELTYKAVSILVKGDISKLDHTDWSQEKDPAECDNSLSTIIGLFKFLLSMPERWQEKDPRVELVLEKSQAKKRSFKGFNRSLRKLEPGVYFKASDGLTYGLESKRIQKIAGQKNLKTGEMVESLEMERMGQQQIDQTKDIDSIIEFNMDLGRAAIFLRRPGEKLPVDDSERETFIRARKNLFSDVPCSIIFNIRSFFLSILIQFARQQIANLPLKGSGITDLQAQPS